MTKELTPTAEQHHLTAGNLEAAAHHHREAAHHLTQGDKESADVHAESASKHMDKAMKSAPMPAVVGKK